MKKNLKLTNKVQELKRVNQFMNEIKQELHLGDELSMNLNLVLEEMVSNVIFYAYPKDEKSEIELTAECNGKTLTFVISDQGREFDPLAKNDPDLDANPAERPIGGMGIYIVKNIMNHVTYQRLDGRNLLTMEKEL